MSSSAAFRRVLPTPSPPLPPPPGGKPSPIDLPAGDTRERLANASPAGLAWAVTAGTPGPWIPFAHLVYLDRFLVDVVQRRLRRLIVGTSVRHGKSELFSTYLPAFALGTEPDDSFLHAMHTAEVVADYGGAAREILELHGERFYGVTVDRSSHRKTNFKMRGRRGRYIGRGVRGSFPSRGGRIFVIDDPTRSYMEASSPRAQADLFNWYTGIARSRLTGDGAVVLIMSRWGMFDLAGQLMRLWDTLGEPYEYVHLPALSLGNEFHRRGPGENAPQCCPNGDALGRPKGEALCPQLYPKPELEAIRAEVGEEIWNAQYQCNPLPARGKYFDREWLRRYERRTILGVDSLIAIGDKERGQPDRVVPLARTRIMQYVDLAAAEAKPGTDPDYFVVMTVAIDLQRKDVYVLDIFRDRIAGPDQGPQLLELARAWHPWRVKIESVAYQLAFVQGAIRDGLPAEPITRSRYADKATRANYAAQRMKNGAWYVPWNAAWLAAYENELVTFPRGHDDQVDCSADAANDLLNPEMDRHRLDRVVASSRMG